MGSAVAIRILGDDPGDVALGQRLVREYVAITAAEVAAPGEPPDVQFFTELIPDARRFSDVYADARAAFLVAEPPGRAGSEVVGCVGIAPFDDVTCEMKRLYVIERWRRRGLGRLLAQEALEVARSLGFERMVLDVVPHRVGAITLYRSMGFRDGPDVLDHPIPTVPLERAL